LNSLSLVPCLCLHRRSAWGFRSLSWASVYLFHNGLGVRSFLLCPPTLSRILIRLHVSNSWMHLYTGSFLRFFATFMYLSSHFPHQFSSDTCNSVPDTCNGETDTCNLVTDTCNHGQDTCIHKAGGCHILKERLPKFRDILMFPTRFSERHPFDSERLETCSEQHRTCSERQCILGV